MSHNQTIFTLANSHRFVLQTALSLVVALYGFSAQAINSNDDLELAFLELFDSQSQPATPLKPDRKPERPAKIEISKKLVVPVMPEMPPERPIETEIALPPEKKVVDKKLIVADVNPVTCPTEGKTTTKRKSDVVTLRELVAKIHAQKQEAEKPAPSRRVAEALAGAPRQAHVPSPRSRPMTSVSARSNNRVISPLPSYSRSMIARKAPPRCRVHPITRRQKTHAGCDMGAKSGSSIVSVLDGTVVDSGYRGGYGNMVTVRHTLPNGKVVFSKYAHMKKDRNCTMPRRGAKLSAGQKIGCVGSTGLSTGPHLHFEIRSAARGGTIYDSKHFLLHNGELKQAKVCGRR